MKVKDKLISSSDKSHGVENSQELRNSHEVDMLHARRSIDPRGNFEGRDGSDLVHSTETREAGRMDVPSLLLEEGCNSSGSSRSLEGENWGDVYHQSDRKSSRGCSKTNENPSSAGALRYALHLRFLCPSKKCSRSVRSVPQRTCIDIEGERRFYLYNDLRVVFPQRHSDADEGKVCGSSFTYSMVLCCFFTWLEYKLLIFIMLTPQTGTVICCKF